MSRFKALLALLVAGALLVSFPCGARGEETVLLNFQGMSVAYIDWNDDSTIYLWGGTPVAYLEGEEIFGFNGRHLGWFVDGYVRGPGGRMAGFTEETISITARPVRVAPPRGVKRTRPVPIPPIPPLPRPVFIDDVSPAVLGELLRRGIL